MLASAPRTDRDPLGVTVALSASTRAGGPAILAGCRTSNAGVRRDCRPRPRRRFPVPLVHLRRNDVPEQAAEQNEERLGSDREHGQCRCRRWPVALGRVG